MVIKILTGLVVVVALGVGGFFLWKDNVEEMEATTEPVPKEVEPLTATFSSSTLGFSVDYPKDYVLDVDYTYDAFGPEKRIHGVKFIIPPSMATGTNLSAFDTGVSVESLPRAVHCTGDIYLMADVGASLLSEGGMVYSVASSSEGAAGNRYEEIVYAVASSSPCTAIRYFIHSTSLDNYPSGTVREFDRASLFQAFDEIRKSLMFTR